jgi:methyl-accepting chemotaxis protein
MVSIFRWGLLGAVTIGVLITIVVASYILNKQAETTGLGTIRYSIDYVKSKMEVNEESRNNLMMESQTILMQNAYALQRLVEVCPQIINQKDALATFCEEQGLDEINISDHHGVIVASIPASNVGISYADYHETKRYLDLITTKNLVIIEKPRLTKGPSYYLEKEQFVGVARLDQPGIIQVGRQSREYEEFLETASITNIAPGLHIGKGGFILICHDGKIVSADNKGFIGKNIDEYIFTPNKEKSYQTTINGIKMIAASDVY